MDCREKVLIKIYGDVINSYKNPENPSFDFVFKRINEGMYDNFLKELENQYIVSNLSDLNYSSCLSFSIINKLDKKIKYGINLSLVGRYAILQQYKTKNYISNLVSNNAEKYSSLVSLFDKHEIILLDENIVNEKLPIKIEDEDFNEETGSCVKNLLFERL